MKVFVDLSIHISCQNCLLVWSFYSDDMGPVEISGIVESVEINSFSKDPEFIVSIICPDPYFTALTPTVVTGITRMEKL